MSCIQLLWQRLFWWLLTPKVLPTQSRDQVRGDKKWGSPAGLELLSGWLVTSRLQWMGEELGREGNRRMNLNPAFFTSKFLHLSSDGLKYFLFGKKFSISSCTLVRMTGRSSPALSQCPPAFSGENQNLFLLLPLTKAAKYKSAPGEEAPEWKQYFNTCREGLKRFPSQRRN